MSRLDRLLSLIDNASSPVIRKAAAVQLGEVQRLHPHELHNLLSSVGNFLRSSSWETRIAAGLALEAILRHVPKWDPVGSNEEEEAKWDPDNQELNFESFDFETVVAQSANLMACDSKELDDVAVDNSAESLEKRKRELSQKIGLDAAASLGINTDNIISIKDVKMSVASMEESNVSKPNVMEVVGASFREMNRIRRKAKLALRRQSSRAEEPESKKQRCETASDNPIPSASVPDTTGLWPPEADEWPIKWFYQALCADLFSTRWETRHGAATGLRHLIATHGRSGGRSSSNPSNLMDKCNQQWLEDIAIRLVCVLTLDRFGDFNTDQVVAPVRETCAQALGSVSLFMTKNQVVLLASILLKLLDQKDWEARHGGLLGLKYTFAVRKDCLEEVVPVCINALHKSLSDGTDDVGAAAGGALALAVPILAKVLPQTAMGIFDTLAYLLPRLDDLTPAANTFVPLMVTLLNHTHIAQNLKGNDKVQKLLERMFFLMAHNNSSVRKASLLTVKALSSYTGPLLTQCLRHVFQRALIEPDISIHPIIYEVWCALIDNSETVPLLEAACPFVSHWLCLAMQPTKLPYDPSVFLQLPKEEKVASLHNMPPGEAEAIMKQSELKLYIGGNEAVPYEEREKNSWDVRFQTSQMIGYLSKVLVVQLPESPPGDALNCYSSMLTVYLNSKSAVQRMITALTIIFWANIAPPSPPPEQLIILLSSCLNETIYFDEIGMAFTKVLQEAKDFIALLKHYQLPEADDFSNQNVLTFDQMEKVCGKEVANSINSKIRIKKTAESLEAKRKFLKTIISNHSSEFTSMSIKTQASLAGAILKLGNLPEKLGPVVKALMDSIKREPHYNLQKLSATHLCELMDHCLMRVPSPANKIVTNLCSYVRSDPEFTPVVISNGNSPNNKQSSGKKDKKDIDKKKLYNDPYVGVVTLARQQKIVEKAIIKSSRGPGRPCKEAILERKLSEQEPSEDELKQKESEIARRGASLALTGLVSYYGEQLPQKLPSLWQPLYQTLNNHIGVIFSHSNGSINNCDNEKREAHDLVGALQVLEIIIPSLHESLFSVVLNRMERLIECTGHKLAGVRHMAGRVAAAAVTRNPKIGLNQLVTQILPRIDAPDACVRSGATEAISILIDKLQLHVLPHLSKLVIPVLGRMSDQDVCVRAMANQTFANLIQLVPLGEGALNDGPDSFLYNLFRPATISNYEIPVPINAKLRPYQQAGVNWLCFLNKYKLHGILCDDMGLGKTIQSICIMAGDHYSRSVEYKETQRHDCGPLPSLVICPPILTGHWYMEVKKFISEDYLNPLQFIGTPVERRRLQYAVKNHNLIIASYDIVRNDIDFFSRQKWNYCILDEGHVIKNGRTKWTQAIKTIEANHRLILSGTPIQNNVLELWSLFDFLMPGFLGTEKQFNAKYSRPILASRDPKSTQKEHQAGVLAMEALHRQVLPFILRRLKEDVLKELPPKITQDYYCELSPLQKKLYDDIPNFQAENFNLNTMKHAHVFQALRYMQSVCNHPKLALKARNRDDILAQLDAEGSSLSDIKHAAKLLALKQLLLDCGIGVERSYDELTSAESSVVNQHRALIFCQLKAMLKILEHDFLKLHMPSVSYLKLDSSMSPAERSATIQLFNNDPSYDVLLLTTRVGGLGLNLTGADTVIFVEHDWSPMRDLQAMDRAHRIGQKKVVNVYRLITKDTLEERIMGLQKFKLLTANTVISSENACLETMGTEKLLELFSKDANNDSEKDSGACESIRSLLDSLPPVSETTDYDEEYDIDNYLAALPASSKS